MIGKTEKPPWGGPGAHFLGELALFLELDDLPSLVCTADRAYPVRQPGAVALRAEAQAGRRQIVMGAPFVASGF